ncbi:MAG TPA: BTAD domain-containing putative transcriptional regulator [Jiangellales bacterium]|nr:BTAD domain-containing putative transcriptional regulator [Jiangellales bacterium]
MERGPTVVAHPSYDPGRTVSSASIHRGAHVEIRLLGPVEVAVGDTVHRLPGAGERALLALLALQAGTVAPADRLVDALWGEDLPANPANALQLRVSKLRRALATMGAEGAAVVTRPPGYLLDAGLARVDAVRAAADVQAARELTAANDVDAALQAYRRALEAWRGPALAEFGEAPWAIGEARRLEELRIVATEEWLALELDAGRHADVLDEIEALVATDPMRERPYGLLMLALYRAGRQADALAVYRQAREVLGEELGLDPSPELRELEAAILRQDESLAAPARRVAPAARPNLPERVASFVGRDGEVADLVRLVTGQRCVTVTGAGGLGKTTVAVEAARAAQPEFGDGTWFVGLAGLTADHQVAARVADVFGLPPADPLHGETAEARLARQLGHRRALVVLDNCEHLVDASARVVQALLAGCPHLVVLATSREPLGVVGEVQYALAPLATAAVGGDGASLADVPAVRLFVDRARAAARSFVPADDDLAVVAQVCERLDGLPLAIELAAARVKTLPVRQISARLDDRFRLLTSGPRTADARQQTLRATVDWSFRLLDEAEQVLLRRLGVFRSAWAVDDAEQVCGRDPLDPADVLDGVGHLVDRSLVVPVGDDGRFRMLETIRQYAAERLADSGELDAVMTRHLAYLLGLAEEAEPYLRGARQAEWRERLRLRHDDLVAVLSYCAAHPDTHGEDGLRLATALGWFWYLGDHEEGRRHLHALLDAVPGASPLVRGRAWQALAMVGRPSACVVHPSRPCAEAAAESLPLLEAAGDDVGAALSRVLLAVEAVPGNTDEGLARLVEAEEILPAGSWEQALADFVRMEVLVRAGDADEGIAAGDRAAAEFDRLGDLWGVSAVRAHQAHNLRATGRTADALPVYDLGLDVARRAGLHNTVQLAAAEAGLARLSVGDEAGARALLEEARAVARRYGYRGGEGLAAVGFGHLARREGRLAQADAAFAEAARLIREVGSLPYLAWACSGRGYVRELMGDLDTAEECHEEVRAISRALPDPNLVALGLEGLAGVAVARGDAQQGARLLGAARRLRSRNQRPAGPLDAPDVERVEAAARQALGDEEFEQSVEAVGTGDSLKPSTITR